MHDVLERIQQNGRHLLGLINDVLDLSKIEAGQLTLSPVEYSMRELVLDVVSATEALAAEKKLALEVDAPADLPRGRGDERRLTQVLMNLVSNAIKFTEAGSVSIRAKVADGSFLVAVTDTGVGIAAEDRERIFEEFQQVDSSSTRKKGGTGLGLAIARRIVELHGGRIWVESTPGQGSTFAFTLPLSRRQAGGRGMSGADLVEQEPRGCRGNRIDEVGPMETRKAHCRAVELLKAGGAAALAAGVAPSIIIPRRARAQQKTLKILQWKHFVPSYDEWFNGTYVKEWGEQNDTEVIVDNVGLGESAAGRRPRLRRRQGHDLVMLLTPQAIYEDQVIDHREIYEECERRYGKAQRFRDQKHLQSQDQQVFWVLALPTSRR